MLPIQFLTSVSILPEVLSQLAACEPPPGLFKEHPCAHGCQKGHRNKPCGNRTEEEWTVKMNLLIVCVQSSFCQIQLHNYQFYNPKSIGHGVLAQNNLHTSTLG